MTEAVSTAVIAVNEINVMLDTLGDASRLAMGALEPDPEPAKLDAIVGDALALLDAESRSRITFESSATQLVGLWDPHLLRRVVSNLVSNALKYSPPGGLVEVEVSQAADGLAQLEVRDHGMGLSTDEATEVFDRFARAERARARGHPRSRSGPLRVPGHHRRARRDHRVAVRRAGTGTTVVVALPLIEDDGEG